MIANILDYGAVSHGKLCTAEIQNAIDDCFLHGGGEVVIPAGVFLSGGLRLRSGVTLHLLEDAVLLGSTSPEDYGAFLQDRIQPIPAEKLEQPVSTIKRVAQAGRSAYPYSRWNNALIRAIHAKDIAIIGEKGAQINGQNCFDELGEEGYRGPHTINMWFCENVTLRGYTVRDSANWAHAIQNSRGIHVSNVTVLGGHDGFDVRSCDDILLEHCTFQTGDDCIAGFDNLNVTVRNCYFESACSIFRFGATDMLVENCKGVAPATYGHRMTLSDEEKRNRAATHAGCRQNCLGVFLYYCDNRAEVRKEPGNILIRNCSFQNPDAILTLLFGHKWCCNRSLRDITFEQCSFDGICTPMKLDCPADTPLTVRMKDCTIRAREGYEDVALINGSNVASVTLERVRTENLRSPDIFCDESTQITVTP